MATTANTSGTLNTTRATPTIPTIQARRAKKGLSQQTASARKPAIRIALANLDPFSSTVLRECCKPLGIETSTVRGEHAVRFREEKFEACALELNSEAASILGVIRSSPLNRTIVIFGFCQGSHQIRQFSRYGVNLLLDLPAERVSLIRGIRSTYPLLAHEFRRYVRIPVLVDITLHTGGRRLVAVTEEVSAGGMSITAMDPLAVSALTTIEFTLPNSKRISTSAAVCWTNKDEKKIGLRFDPADVRRLQVREWIDEYLDTV